MAKGALTHGNYNTEIVSKDYTKKPTEATLSFDLLKKTTPLDDGYIHLRIKIVDCNNMIHTELRKIKYETN